MLVGPGLWWAFLQNVQMEEPNHGTLAYFITSSVPIYRRYSFFARILTHGLSNLYFLLVLDMKVEENKETPDLLSIPLRFVCGISHVGVNFSTNSALNLARVLYFGIFFKKLYLL
jgi:hypothetical protein